MNADFSGKRVTVMGLGRFGGGIGVTRFLCSRGADVLVTDTDPAEKLADSLGAIKPLTDRGRVSLRLGEHNVSDFTTCDLVVANAAVPKPWEDRFLRAAEAASIPVTTEIALLIDELPQSARDRTIAVTGSAGKSTTTAMIHQALSEVARGGEVAGMRRVLLGGNIGGSLLEQAATVDDQTWLVLELSSAMLYWIERTRARGSAWSPRVGVITNISPNHLDWHGDFAHYQGSKLSMIRHARPSDTAILGESVWEHRAATGAMTVRIDPAAFTWPMRLPGRHNRDNAAAALLACQAAAPGVPAPRLAEAIASFRGLAHRLQLVAEVRIGPGEPARFYNDSKSTTPESCLKALEALEEVPGLSASKIHLIAGGYDKGSDLSPISHAGARLAGLYTIGKTGPAVTAAAPLGKAFACQTLDRAFDAALARMKPGEALLLSPGCASWDQYTNFEARGDEFVRLVERLQR